MSSQKQCRRIREFEKQQRYNHRMLDWYESRPPRIRFISYARWKKSKPKP